MLETGLFWLSKLGPALFYPLPFALAAGGLVLAALPKLPRRRAVKPLLWGLWALLGLASQPLLAEAWAQAWEVPLGWQGAENGDAGAEAPFDAVVVLGGAVIPTVSPPGHPQTNSAAERLSAAFALWRAGKAPVLVHSGGSGTPWNQEQREDGPVRDWLIQAGLPEEALVLETESRNTWENAVNTLALARERGWTRLAVVTSAWHVPRARGHFRAAASTGAAPESGLQPQVTWFAADTLGQAPEGPDALIPDPWALIMTESLLKEAVGLGVSALLGRWQP